MDKKRFISVSSTIAVLIILGMVFSYFFSPESMNPNTVSYSKMPTASFTGDAEYRARYSPGNSLIAGIITLLLVGYLFWVCYRKFLRDMQTEHAVKENKLNQLSMDTGRNEYDLFCKSAEKWSVSRHIIDQDFRRYMADQVLPHYARDFVRKNQTHIDESLKIKSEVEPTTIRDWLIALLVFPGSVLLMLFMSILLI